MKALTIEAFVARQQKLCDALHRDNPYWWVDDLITGEFTDRTICNYMGTIAKTWGWKCKENANFIAAARSSLPAALGIITKLLAVKRAAESWRKDRTENHDGAYDNLNEFELALFAALDDLK